MKQFLNYQTSERKEKEKTLAHTDIKINRNACSILYTWFSYNTIHSEFIQWYVYVSNVKILFLMNNKKYLTLIMT